MQDINSGAADSTLAIMAINSLSLWKAQDMEKMSDVLMECRTGSIHKWASSLPSAISHYCNI